MWMRKILVLVLCMVFMIQPVRGTQTQKYAVLTFDDGPSGRYTRTLLEGLAEREVKATFLLCGYRSELAPELTRRIWEEGHEIGYHGYSHCCMGKMCRAQIRKELCDTRAILPEDCQPVFLRPPGGILNDTVRQTAREAGLPILTWSVDPRDWATTDAAAVERAVLEKVRDGDVILLHDMSNSSVEAALAIVDAMLAEGYIFCTASELARLRGVTPEPGRVYSRFP